MSSSHAHHIVPLKVYLTIGAALLFLTAVTVWASYIDLGNWNIVVALVIAAFKASLVAMFFMHLKYDNKLNLVIFLIGIAFLTIFIGFTMFDTLRRGEFYNETDGAINKNAGIYKQVSDSTTAAPADVETNQLETTGP